MSGKANIAIVIYTTYHHVYKLAKSVKEGIDASGVATATIYRVPETLPEEVLKKMGAPPAPDVPVATPETLANAHGFMFGFPTRFGTMPAQFKAFLDSTGQLWFSKTLFGKAAGLFFSTSGQHGGQETTAFTSIAYLAHHGIVYVPLGNEHAGLSDMKELVGGSYWGAGTITGPDGARQPSALELDIAKVQGQSFAKVVSKLNK